MQIWWAVLFVAAIATVVMTFLVPESPHWQHDKDEPERYQLARESLIEVAAFNGVTHVKDRPYANFKFVLEAKKEGINAAEMEALISNSERSNEVA